MAPSRGPGPASPPSRHQAQMTFTSNSPERLLDFERHPGQLLSRREASHRGMGLPSSRRTGRAESDLAAVKTCTVALQTVSMLPGDFPGGSPTARIVVRLRDASCPCSERLAGCWILPQPRCILQHLEAARRGRRATPPRCLTPQFASDYRYLMRAATKNRSQDRAGRSLAIAQPAGGDCVSGGLVARHATSALLRLATE
jgi:hypothetical protein